MAALRLRQLPNPLKKGHVEVLRQLDKTCFPIDTPYSPTTEGTTWWLVYDEDKVPVAFAGVRYMPIDNYFYLCRAGVIPRARGKGLQRRLIRVRLAFAKKRGAAGVYTMTSVDNPASSNNLIRCGFELFIPSYEWGGTGMIYWWKDLKKLRKK